MGDDRGSAANNDEVHARRDEAFLLREHATAERLARFRGEMCDLDFARLVSAVLRLRDKAEGRGKGQRDPYINIFKTKREEP